MNSPQSCEHRGNTQVITLHQVTQEFAAPERLRLQLSEKVIKKPLDIGSWAYFIRGKNESIFDHRGTPVAVESFVKSRCELIVRFLESVVGLRDASVLGKFKILDGFVEWLNLNDYREIFAGEVDAQRAYRGYTAYLNHQIAHQKWKPISAAQAQQYAAKLIELIYPDSSHYILAGVVKIISEKGSASAGSANLELYRDVCLAIAEQCSDFVLGNKPYPCVVKIRDYEVVVFPSNHGAVGPFKTSPLSFNAAQRRIVTLEEYYTACEKSGRKGSNKSTVVRELELVRVRLQVANQDERHWHRLNLAGLAAKAYVALFLMITGATPTEFAQFSYADALDVEMSPLKKQLSAVKFRAAGKSNTYNIGREEGLSLLRQYIKLRNWILNGAVCERLFMAMPESGRSNITEDVFTELNVSDAIKKFHNSISGVFLDPKMPSLSPRKLRKLKSNGMHTAGFSPSTVAASLGHTEAVNHAHYADAMPEQMMAELYPFWRAIRHAAQVVRERSQAAIGGGISTGAGHCDGFNQPIPLRGLGGFTIEPNCRSQYGCLYCEHYICHSDEEDIHKLLSLQFVINAVRKVAPDTAHAEALYKELHIRIEFILDALAERSETVKQLVKTVRTRVLEYGELTAFWEARLSRYEKVGVAF